jgi:hypothetical protein
VVSIKLRCAAKAGDALPGVERELDYLGMLNKALPADIRARGWCPLPDDTHPAFTARCDPHPHAAPAALTHNVVVLQLAYTARLGGPPREVLYTVALRGVR